MVGDTHLGTILQQLEEDVQRGRPTSRMDKYHTMHGCLYRKGRLCISVGMGEAKQRILHDMHDAPVAGHMGTYKTYFRIKQHYW